MKIVEMSKYDAKFATYEDFLKTLQKINEQSPIKKIVSVMICEDGTINHCNAGTDLLESIGMMSGYAGLRINEEFIKS